MRQPQVCAETHAHKDTQASVTAEFPSPKLWAACVCIGLSGRRAVVPGGPGWITIAIV